MPKLYSKRKEKTVDDLERTTSSSFTLVTDAWSDSNRCLVNFVLVNPTTSVFLKSVDVQDNSKTGEFIYSLINEVVLSLGTSRVSHVVIDNGSNFVKAMEMLSTTHPSVFATPCACHTLNLSLDDVKSILISSNWPTITTFFEDLDCFVSFFSSHTIPKFVLKKYVGHKIKKYCPTRFYYRYLVL
ncbi:hypothetical protein RCL1_006646 [Eukaryota sp. TZLM3-RCL]